MSKSLVVFGLIRARCLPLEALVAVIMFLFFCLASAVYSVNNVLRDHMHDLFEKS